MGSVGAEFDGFAGSAGVEGLLDAAGVGFRFVGGVEGGVGGVPLARFPSNLRVEP